MEKTPIVQKLYDAALKVRENAYCPFSHYKVGVAIEAEDGTIYVGCNVESVTYTNSTHAEMNAIDTAVADGVKKIKRVLLITQEEKPAFPCALCRQKIIEFGADAEVIAANPSGDIEIKSIKDLYPEPFVSI